MSYIHHYKNNFFPNNCDLPFQLKINFKKLIDWWKEQALLSDPFESNKAKEVLKRVEKTPELFNPFDDFNLIEKYQEEIHLLLSPFFPSLTTTNEIKAAGVPFRPMLFNLTKRFDNILNGAQGDVLIPESSSDLIYIFSCITILNSYYKANVSLSPNLFFNIRDKQTAIVRRYRAFINADFTEIIPGPDVQLLSEKEIYELTGNFGNTELWKKKIPPNSFNFEGFTILTLFDVTRDESVSALKFDLIKKDSLSRPDIVAQIQNNLGAMLNIPRLKIGFISYNKDRELLQSIGFGNSIVLADKKNIKIDEAFCSLSNKFSFEKNQSLVFPQIDEKAPGENILLRKLAKLGFKSFLAMPLFYNDEFIGILEAGSEQPNALNTITVYKLQEVISLFTIAMKRSQDEMKNQIDAIIRQKCTAIHATVAWRFIEAAERFLESSNTDDDNMEDIVFSNVYPLYGQTDIQGSSIERNLSIQADLIEQLSLAKNILNLSVKKFSLPAYKDLRYRVDKYIQQLGKELSAGDENVILEFLKMEIYPVFNHLHSLNTEIHEALQHYENQLDPVFGLLYKKRKAYDESVKLINENISAYLDKAQQAAQNMFPHYFEKYKSDGVEHNLYIGQSMVNNKKFNQLYLQNLRLWQLMITCEVENEIHRLKPHLKTKLDVCSLILVHSQPLSIRFRMEEKKFDVDGAYNARYEIIKKRIDKATAKETGERLTQPGKIAIIYSYENEAKEYLNYIHYLQFINYIGSDLEWLTLKDLQGMTGLKALRVSILYNKIDGIKESKAVKLVKEINQN
ncbi:MAG: GAF domain-containing protein [Bacteroidia bacterium]